MFCPVCNKLYFSKDKDPIVENHLDQQCHICGWKYDLEQTENPDLKNGTNKLSLNEYRNWYQSQLKKNPSFNYTDDRYKPKPHKCPVCGKYEFGEESSFDICPFCGWEDDGVMEEYPNQFDGCANDLCLNLFKERYQKEIKKNPNYKFKKDGLPS